MREAPSAYHNPLIYVAAAKRVNIRHDSHAKMRNHAREYGLVVEIIRHHGQRPALPKIAPIQNRAALGQK
jgi:hypothetical protein